MDSISAEEIFRITQQVWAPMLGFGLILKADRGGEDRPDGRATIGSILLEGDWKGGVTLDFENRLAKMSAGHIFGMETDEVEAEDVHDAVGELANQVGGLIKGKLAPKSLLSLPTITEGIELTVDIPHCQPIGAATMESEGVWFRVEVWKYVPEAQNIKIEYLENRNTNDLSISNKYRGSKTFLAYYYKGIRLIDNF